MNLMSMINQNLEIICYTFWFMNIEELCPKSTIILLYIYIHCGRNQCTNLGRHKIVISSNELSCLDKPSISLIVLGKGKNHNFIFCPSLKIFKINCSLLYNFFKNNIIFEPVPPFFPSIDITSLLPYLHYRLLRRPLRLNDKIRYIFIHCIYKRHESLRQNILNWSSRTKTIKYESSNEIQTVKLYIYYIFLSLRAH
jgi:hypothetical protein